TAPPASPRQPAAAAPSSRTAATRRPRPHEPSLHCLQPCWPTPVAAARRSSPPAAPTRPADPPDPPPTTQPDPTSTTLRRTRPTAGSWPVPRLSHQANQGCPTAAAAALRRRTRVLHLCLSAVVL